MAKLPFPDVSPGPLRKLLEELHDLHARAGWPSVREISSGQNFSHTAVHELFTKPMGDRKLPVLLSVVEKLASLAPRVNEEATLDKFDQLWYAATGLTGIKKQDNLMVSRLEDEHGEQHKVETQRFAAELKKVVEQNGQTFSLRAFSARAHLSGTLILDIISGRRIPREGVLLPILKAADASDNDIDRLMAQASQLRDQKRRLDANRTRG